MKKNWLWFSLILNALLLIILAICGLLLTKTNCASNQGPSNKMASEESVKALTFPEGTEFYEPKPISLEWMTPEEKNSFGIDTSTESRIQVLKRDDSGKVQDYRIIRDDKDILTEY